MKSLVFLSILAGLGYSIFRPALSGEAGKPRRSSPVYCAPAMDAAKLTDDHGPLIAAFRLSHFTISTQSDSAQLYFDQGLSQLYAFNHGEAGRSFKTAMRLDPDAAMTYWGMAMVLGPNYNAALNPEALGQINETLGKAHTKSAKTSPKEKQLIEALSKRFPSGPVDDITPYNTAYSEAMAKLHAAYPDDVEIGVLYADALMNEHPWNFWNKDGSPQPWTNHTMNELEKLLERWPEHPGLIHYYIHLTEASKHADKALPYADKLGELAKNNGHLVHMPSHTYIRTGQYHKGVLVNEVAAQADSAYVNQCKASGFYPMLLYPHNVHFLAACAYLEGNSSKAIKAAWEVSSLADRQYLGESITLQHYFNIPYYVLPQFEKWDEILRLPTPGDSLLYPTALWHYARGMAYCGKGDLPSARKELEGIQKIAVTNVLEKQLIWDINNAQQLAEIALRLLEGEILMKDGEAGKAIPILKEAVDLEDKLYYTEPPDWFFSVRLSLGKCLLITGQAAEAEKIYSEDLQNFAENGWALHGLYKARLAQNKKDSAADAYARYEKAWQWADFKLK